MKITVLAENSKSEGSDLTSEFGLSLYIEYEGKKYLVDTGSADAYLKNAEKLGIDLTDVDVCLISHGHFDHAGGLPEFLKINSKAPVYMMNTAAEGHFLQQKDGSQKYIGIPEGLEQDETGRIQLVDKAMEIRSGVTVIPHFTKGLAKIGETANMYKKAGAGYAPDDFDHERSIVFETEKGLVIVSSCSHAGAGNIIHEVAAKFSGSPVYAFIGGLHMMSLQDKEEVCTVPEPEIERLAGQFREIGLHEMWTGHCTGNIAYGLLTKYMGPEQIHHLITGAQFEIGGR